MGKLSWCHQHGLSNKCRWISDLYFEGLGRKEIDLNRARQSASSGTLGSSGHHRRMEWNLNGSVMRLDPTSHERGSVRWRRHGRSVRNGRRTHVNRLRRSVNNRKDRCIAHPAHICSWNFIFLKNYIQLESFKLTVRLLPLTLFVKNVLLKFCFNHFLFLFSIGRKPDCKFKYSN